MRRMVIAIALCVAACSDARSNDPAGRDASEPARRSRAAPSEPDPSYVGSSACARCHAEQARRWTGSDHDLAMQAATPETALGRFDGSSLAAAGEQHRFVREGARLLVEVRAPGSKPERHPVAHVLGVDPLQQLLLDVGDGRLQALTTAWDARPDADGGQRWFSLRDDTRPGDPLHWTGPRYTWNTQCADCHSTGVERGYELDSDRFATRMAELDVGCEACHGPGSTHVEWATAAQRGPDPRLARPLSKPGSRRWELHEGQAIARLSTLPDRRELDVCGPCHSRRTDLGPGRGRGFADRYRLALIDDGLYFADGQIRDEVFVLGSFLQSKMHAAGVICSDCHEPHGLELRASSVRETCTSCHRAEVFARPKHHFHPPDSEAASCESCHMPARVYMGVDPRRDHRFGVPQPRRSATLGAPDPCLGCHFDHDATWAQAQIDRRFGERAERWEFGSALGLARAGEPWAAAALARIVGESRGPAIVRATALTELAATLTPTPSFAELVANAAADPDPLVRRAAATAATALPPPLRVATIRSLLRDPVRSVRIEAVGALLELDFAWTADERAARDEYRDAKRYAGDQPEALVDLAALDLQAGDPERAATKLARAIAKDPSFTPAHLNLADLARARGREPEAEAVLRRALDLAAEPALIHHALGLALVRTNRRDEALAELRRAHELAPEQARLSYVYALALLDAGERDQAKAILEAASRRHREEPLLRATLDELTRTAPR